MAGKAAAAQSRDKPARPARKRLTREELTPLAREALFQAAARVVGEVGYAQASVARITAAAGVAQGTFYLYFSTRQALFDELLPHARREFLAQVRQRAAGACDFFELEEAGMAVFLDYVEARPGFIRILNEAEAVAPQAWRSHYEDIAQRYRRELRAAARRGEIRPLRGATLHTAVHLLMGARISLHQARMQSPTSTPASKRSVLAAYMAMVRAWLAPQA